MNKSPKSQSNLINEDRVDSILRELDALVAHNKRLLHRLDEAELQQREVEELLEDNKKQLSLAVIAHPELRRMSLAVDKARDMLMGVGTDELKELATYRNPPDRVKMVLEAMVFVMKGQKLPWEKIMREMVVDFVYRVVAIQWELLNPKIVEELKVNYLENPQWNIAKIYRASKAAGPLADWLESQSKVLEFLSRGGLDIGKITMLITTKNKLIIEEQRIKREYLQLQIDQKDAEDKIKNLNARKAVFLSKGGKIMKTEGTSRHTRSQSIKSITSEMNQRTLRRQDKSNTQNKSNKSLVDDGSQRDTSRSKINIKSQLKISTSGIKSTSRIRKVDGVNSKKSVDAKHKQSAPIEMEHIKSHTNPFSHEFEAERDYYIRRTAQSGQEKRRDKSSYHQYNFTITRQSKSPQISHVVDNDEFKNHGKSSGNVFYDTKDRNSMNRTSEPKLVEIRSEVIEYNFQAPPSSFQNKNIQRSIAQISSQQNLPDQKLESLFQSKSLAHTSRPFINESDVSNKIIVKNHVSNEYEIAKSQQTSIAQIDNSIKEKVENPKKAEGAPIIKAKLLPDRSIDLIKSNSESSISRNSNLSSKFSVNRQDKPTWNATENYSKKVYMPDQDVDRTIYLANMFKENEIDHPVHQTRDDLGSSINGSNFDGLHKNGGINKSFSPAPSSTNLKSKSYIKNEFNNNFSERYEQAPERKLNGVGSRNFFDDAY